MADIQRQTAYKINISQIVNAKYVHREGWEPNYLEINNKKVSRVNVVAAIVAKENNIITIDDGSGQINLIIFSEEKNILNVDIADMIMLIGRPREYTGQRYIVPEIIKKIENKKWIFYRRKELELQIIHKNNISEKRVDISTNLHKESIKENSNEKIELQKESLASSSNNLIKSQASKIISEVIDDVSQNTTKKQLSVEQKIINAIKKLDKGPGVNIDDVINEVEGVDVEKHLYILIKEGEIFEIRAGKVKTL